MVESKSTRGTSTSAPTVTESAGDLATSEGGARGGSSSASNASDASDASAEGYIGLSCASPARDDQQRCLKGYLAHSDLQLDRSYQALISRLKSESGTRTGDADPPVVQRLRATQRNWLVYRDDECRKRTAPTEGPLWAP